MQIKAKLIRLLLVVLLIANSAVTFAKANENVPVFEKINVFAVLSQNIEESFKQTASALKNEENVDSFPTLGFQVHCTLYMTQYPVGSKDQVLARIEQLASTTRQFDISTTGLELTSGNWFFMNLERNRNLQSLSDTVVNQLEPLRFKSDFVPQWAKAFPNKLEYIKKYGSPNVFAEFNPHLTFLARADAEKLQRFMKNHENSDFVKPVTGKIIGIGAAIADRNGQIPEVWKIFPLQPAR
jgi:2'-5' RNA ligase